MKKDRIYAEKSDHVPAFEFNEEVANVFDDMISRSVPLYKEQQKLITRITKNFFIDGKCVYDIGCSTATTLINLCNSMDKGTRFIGYDNSRPMLEKAKKKTEENGLTERIELRFSDLNDQNNNIDLDNAGIITMLWTLQFVRPQFRKSLIQHIYSSLAKGGVLIVTEKITTNDQYMNPYFIELYHDYKKENGYSSNEINRKREALENVLVPLTLDENIQLFKSNGFEIVDTFFQYYNFAGFLCIKSD